MMDEQFVEALDSTTVDDLYTKFADTNDAETFVFYSDPHYLLNQGEMTPDRIRMICDEWMKQLKTRADAINAQAVICGGDLINAESSDAVLCYKLGLHNAIARKYFGNKYHLALGNHDTRFDATPQDTLDNLLYAEEDTQKAYYTVKTPKTLYYFLNSATDQSSPMTTYRWEQVDWFAKKLLTGTEENRILVMHIIANDASGDPDNFASKITPMATNCISVIDAYNAKESVTLNGETYDFTNATGKVRCILCGHTHYDKVYVTDSGLPVVCVDDATSIGVSRKLRFNTCLADYENGSLYVYRDGLETVEVTLA